MNLVAVPVKSFGLAKARLAAVFDQRQRADLSRATAAHTVTAILEAVGEATVIAGDGEVADWAHRLGADVVVEASGKSKGLSDAAQSVVDRRDVERWMIVHADLPLIHPDDIRAAWEGIPPAGFLLAPSHDGGTSVIGGDRVTLSFSYGPGSFHRHLAAAFNRPHRIVTRRGFLLDLDSPSDYAAAINDPDGSWLQLAFGR
jgi:2-phospho-L-lactate guanylyltransferase